MADHLGQFNASSTVHLYFTTHAATGAPVAPSSGFEAADLLIYKNGSATQRSSASGITMTSPFDSVVGLHAVAIDLSDNTDSGFYAAGSEYVVILNADETVDSVAVTKVLAYFSIERVPKVNVTQFGGTAGTFASGRPEVNATHIGGTSQTGRDLGASVLLSSGTGTGQVSLSSGTVTAGTISANAVNASALAADAVAEILAAIEGGELANISNDVDTLTTNVAAILADTAEIGAAGAGLTALASAANLSTLTGYVDTEVAAIKAKTDNLPASPAATGDIAAALATYDGPTNTEMVAAFTEIKGATWNSSTDTLEAIRNQGDAAWITSTFSITAGAIASQVRTELTTELGRMDAAVSTRLATAGYTTPPTTAEIKAGLDIGASGGVAGHTTLSGVSTNVSAILADTGTDGVILSAATCNKIADHTRRRTQANVEASSDGDTLGYSSEYGFIQQAQESNTTDNAGKLTVYRTDGTTELAQKTLTTDETAEPITGIE